MTCDAATARERLHQWILEEGSRRDTRGPPADVDLMKEGWIDSLGLMTLISYVEDLLGRPLEDREMRMQNFMSIDSIVQTWFAPGRA